MNKHEKEVVKAQLMSEKQTLKTIQAVYKKALEDIENKLKISDGKISVLLKDIDSLTDEQKSILQSQIYQRKFQRSLKSQLEIMLKDLAVNQYGTVSEYLKASYHNGYIGALYNINIQGMPLIMPIDPYLVHRAIEIDSKIKHGLYQNLVDKVDVFKRRIANDISRGIASSTSYHDMATWIRHGTKVSVGQSMRIVRTEGNRIYNAAALDCGKGAKERGCDLVKVWDSTLDMKTRPTHRECDGQVRELDEDFKNANGEAKAPGQFGIASEDINCRCAVLIKPRWDVDGKFTKRDNQSGELKEFEGIKEYEEFKKRFWENIEKSKGVTEITAVTNAFKNNYKRELVKVAAVKETAKGSLEFINKPVEQLEPEIGNTSGGITENQGKGVDISGESGIIKEKNETAVEDVKHIGNIDLNKLHGITNKKILTDEVVLTNNRVSHIIERRGQDFYDEYNQYFSDIISDPDYIFKDQKEDTAIVSKTIKHKDKYVNLVLRLAVEGDNPEYKNSIITAVGESKKRFSQRLRNNKPTYRKSVDNNE